MNKKKNKFNNLFNNNKKDLNKISDDVSLVDRSILDDIPGKWGILIVLK